MGRSRPIDPLRSSASLWRRPAPSIVEARKSPEFCRGHPAAVAAVHTHRDTLERRAAREAPFVQQRKRRWLEARSGVRGEAVAEVLERRAQLRAQFGSRITLGFLLSGIVHGLALQ